VKEKTTEINPVPLLFYQNISQGIPSYGTQVSAVGS